MTETESKKSATLESFGSIVPRHRASNRWVSRQKYCPYTFYSISTESADRWPWRRSEFQTPPRPFVAVRRRLVIAILLLVSFILESYSSYQDEQCCWSRYRSTELGHRCGGPRWRRCYFERKLEPSQPVSFGFHWWYLRMSVGKRRRDLCSSLLLEIIRLL